MQLRCWKAHSSGANRPRLIPNGQQHRYPASSSSPSACVTAQRSSSSVTQRHCGAYSTVAQSSSGSQQGISSASDAAASHSEAIEHPEESVKSAVQSNGAGSMQYPSDKSSLLSGIEEGKGHHSKGQRQQQTATLQQYAHWAIALGGLWIADKAVARAAKYAGISFPPPLIGMFIIIASLWGAGTVSEPAAKRVAGFFKPGLDWIQRWLPLFYVPSLITLPLALTQFAGIDLVKILGLVIVGMPATLLVTAQVAILIRKYSKTEMEPHEPQDSMPPFSKLHYAAWGGTWLVSLAAVAFSSSTQTIQHASTAFMLAATVGGYLIGCSFPAKVTQLLHPMITTAVLANVSAVILGSVTGAGFQNTLRSFLTKNPAAQGAGDWLMSFLGVVILSFGFKIYSQRRLMVRHAPEIFGSTTASATFSMYGTAFAAKASGLAPELSRALIPRSVTVALALPMAAQLNAPAAITVAGVALSGLLGANFGQSIMTRVGYKDPIARGLAQAGAAHGLGTAAIASEEPEALPFCALAYALIGVISTVLVSIPAVRGSLVAITA